MAKIPINLVTGSLQKEEVIVGIDLGTTNSLISIIHPQTGLPAVLKEFDNSSLVPSVIYFDAYNNAVVGSAAKEKLITEPERTVFSSKRLMGKSYADVSAKSQLYSYKILDDGSENLVKIQVGNKFYSPVDLAALILKELKARAEHILKTPVTKAVITVPAYFNDVQRQATRNAGKLAGLDVLRIINEPTAASLSYGFGLKKGEHKKVAVYDLGGGTFDISLLNINDGFFEVLATHGDTYLGGDDIDSAIVDYWLAQNDKKTGLLDDLHRQIYRLRAEEAKKYLSDNKEFNSSINGEALRLTREELNRLVDPLINRTIESCKQSLKDAGLAPYEIDEVIMVGGSTRIPAIKERIGNFFGQKVHDDLNPDEVVSLGAAIQADVLAGNNKEVLLLDITPLSLGLETSGGLMDVLMPRNSKVPSRVSRQYTTQVDGQSGMRISVYQGERDLVKDNRKLGEFNLTGIPAMPAGLPKVEVAFTINADAILSVTARELRSGVEQSIVLQPQYGISDEDVERMLLESITNAQEDIQTRALTEARVEGEQLLKTTEQFMQKHSRSLSREELTITANAMQALQMAITMTDKDLIHKKVEELNEVSKPFAERIMDEAIKKALVDKKV